jgi:hypothetical protein
MTLTRKQFLINLAVSGVALAVNPVLLSSKAFRAVQFKKICLPPDSDLPLRTAAIELAEQTGAKIVYQSHTGVIDHGSIVLVAGSNIGTYPEAISVLPVQYSQIEWELVHRIGDGLLIAGSMPRNVCRAVLGWITNPARETDRLSIYRFDDRFTMWDNSLNQMNRFSIGFDRDRHIREIARLGHTGIEINRYADTGGYHVMHRKFPLDQYPWYMSYCPALDAFVESSLTKGIYLPQELEANRNDLREAAEISRKFGLKPGFVTYEPRGVAEEIFDRYPELRGSRIDHPGRGLQPRYNMDIANPRVLEHYSELLTNLMKVIPDLRYFVYWTNDSGAGLPFAHDLYAGPNGSYLAKSKKLEQMNADFSRTLLEAGRKINPDFEVIMNIGWEYGPDERKRLISALPKGVTLSHPIGGSLLKDEVDYKETFVIDDRALGIEPYASIIVAAGFDPEPIIAIPTPTLLAKKFALIKRLNMRQLFTLGGTYSPPQCPFNINQELYAELIREENVDLDQFLMQTATHWCEGDTKQAKLLVQAWQIGDDAIENWPNLSWWTAGPAQTQGRWITRPLVPDISKLNKRELAAWERMLFTAYFDLARVNVVFHGSVRMFTEEEFEGAIKAFDEKMIPKLEKAISILNQAFQISKKAVIEDQRDRYMGILLRSRTDRNLYDAQVAINYYLLKKSDPEIQRQRLRRAIEADIANTTDWIHALTESKTNFFHISAKEETPFMYKTPIEDLQLKIVAMRAHINDQPGPYLKELAETNLNFKN